MFTPNREDARKFWVETWKKYQAQQTLTDLEAEALALIHLHPEYQPLLHDDALDHEWAPEAGNINPFLHLMLHLAIVEQLSIDQPPGIRAVHQRLCLKLQDEHAANHVLIECLGEMLWEAQRAQQAPDQARYLQLLNSRAGVDMQ